MGRMLKTRNKTGKESSSDRKLRDITSSIRKQTEKYGRVVGILYQLFGREKFRIREAKGKTPWSIRTLQNYLRDSREMGFVGQCGIGVTARWWIKPNGVNNITS